jgi:hypothetical protein
MPIIIKNQPMPLSLIWYVIAWLFFVYMFIGILSFTAEGSSNLLLNGLYFVEFGVHEASHMIVSFLPSIMVAMAGSIGEISFTVLILIATLKAKSYFTSIFASLWVMLAFNSVGRYIADARTELLPLMGPSDNVQHDWHFILNQFGWLNLDTIIGNTVRGVGNFIGAVALLMGLWLMYRKLVQKPMPIVSTDILNINLKK